MTQVYFILKSDSYHQGPMGLEVPSRPITYFHGESSDSSLWSLVLLIDSSLGWWLERALCIIHKSWENVCTTYRICAIKRPAFYKTSRVFLWWYIRILPNFASKSPKKWTFRAKKWRFIRILLKWRSNQEWPFICADTVCRVEFSKPNIEISITVTKASKLRRLYSHMGTHFFRCFT